MKVSVVLASKNPNVDFLNRAIESVLLQNYKDFEFIIVDDGSSEPIEGKIAPLLEDSRIKLYRFEESKGLGAALNYGIQLSSGSYIARLDDDDVMRVDRIQKQVSYLDSHPAVSCVGTQLYEISKTHKRKHRKYPTKHKDILEDMLQLKWAMAHTTLMFRRDSFNKIGGYRITGGGQDIDLILQLALVGKLANLDEYLTAYYVSGSGLASTNPNKYKAYLFAYKSLIETNALPEYNDTINNTILHINKILSESKHQTPFIRKIMVLRINLLGKKFRNNKIWD